MRESLRMRDARRGLIWLLLALIAVAGLAACTPGDAPAEDETFEGPPVVRILSPSPDAVYLAGASVNILARVENAGPDMGRVELLMNSVNIGTTDASAQTAPAFSIESGWPATIAGDYTLTVTAFREDGSASEPTSVNFEVRSSVIAPTQAGDGDQTTPQQTQTSPQPDSIVTIPPLQPQNTQTPTPTATDTTTDASPTPEASPMSVASPTPSFPTVRLQQGANIRRGPGVAFDPPIGSLAAGEVRRILARNPDNSWYRIEVFNSSGWVFSELVEVSGSVSGLPVENPPTPVPPPTATITPVPAQVDLSIVNWSTAPSPQVCNQPATTTITIANSGSSPSAQTNVRLDDLVNGQVQATSSATVPPLQPGENVTVQITLTVSTFFLQGHTVRAIVDPDNVVPETNEENNSRQFDYVLQQGSC